MPAAWSRKDERQYKHVLQSCKQRGRYGLQRCKRVAGATVNKQRRREGRTLSGIFGMTDTTQEKLAQRVMLAGAVATGIGVLAPSDPLRRNLLTFGPGVFGGGALLYPNSMVRSFGPPALLWSAFAYGFK